MDFDKTITFPCTMCGCCCKRVDKAVESFKFLTNDEVDFPYTWNESGKCEMLSDDNKCKVYDNRPFICNIEKIAEHYGLDKKRFYSLNIETCNKMMDEDGVDEGFRIKNPL